MGKDVIIACDFDSAEKTFAFLDRFTGRKPFVKIGMELYYAEGPSIVREIKKRGHKIFLDLKLHDIPNTVKKSMAVLSRLDVDMTNLHAAGTVHHFNNQRHQESPLSFCVSASGRYHFFSCSHRSSNVIASRIRFLSSALGRFAAMSVFFMAFPFVQDFLQPA